MNFFIVDVFGREKYSGNQLAVVLVEEHLSTEDMQIIAREFHFSETSFISLQDSHENVFKVNIFTPNREVPFAGHPTLGTAYIIRNELLKGTWNEIVLDLPVGRIPVTIDAEGLLWMKQVQPVFGEIHTPVDIAPTISLAEDEIDSRYPIENATTGIEFVLIPLKKLDSIKSAVTNITEFKKYFNSRDKEPRPFFLFCPETYEKDNDLNARMFADAFGILEDPATGSATGSLSAYLLKHDYFKSSSIDIRVEQGFEIKRRSILHVSSHLKDGVYDINVGGRVFKVAEGKLD